jgi:hypothetical protein
MDETLAALRDAAFAVGHALEALSETNERLEGADKEKVQQWFVELESMDMGLVRMFNRRARRLAKALRDDPKGLLREAEGGGS